MARLPRVDLPGIPQHVVQRGNNRSACFFDDGDYRFYLECLRNAADKYDCKLHAYALMTNHAHLLVTSEVPAGISRMMQSVGRSYVRRVNGLYRRSGTLWEGRFKACLVDSEQYFLTCCRYIELNPVRAGMVAAPGDYRWSSYRVHAWGEVSPWLKEHEAYTALGRSREERQAAYRLLFRQCLDAEVLTAIRSAVNRLGVLGSLRFQEQVEATLARRVCPLPIGRPRRERGHAGSA